MITSRSIHPFHSLRALPITFAGQRRMDFFRPAIARASKAAAPALGKNFDFSRDWSRADFLKWTLTELRKAKVVDYPYTAETLITHRLGIGRLDLYFHSYQTIETNALRGLVHDVSRLAGGLPISYLTGFHVFGGSVIHMTKGVFPIRPETENLVDIAWECLEFRNPDHQRTPAEFVCVPGIGSGADLASLMDKRSLHRPGERRQTSIFADVVDNSPAALSLAKRNLAFRGFGDEVRFFNGDWLICPSLRQGKYHVIMANPPYFSAEVLRRERSSTLLAAPRKAIYGGKDGLVMIRRTLLESLPLLDQEGFLVMEIDRAQAEGMKTLMTEYPDYASWAIVNRSRGRSSVLVATKIPQFDFDYFHKQKPDPYYLSVVEKTSGYTNLENRIARAQAFELTNRLRELIKFLGDFDSLPEVDRKGTDRQWVEQLFHEGQKLVANFQHHLVNHKNPLPDKLQVFVAHMRVVALLDKHDLRSIGHFRLANIRSGAHTGGAYSDFGELLILLDRVDSLVREINQLKSSLPYEFRDGALNEGEIAQVKKHDRILEKVTLAFISGSRNQFGERLSHTTSANWRNLRVGLCDLIVTLERWRIRYARINSRSYALKGERPKPEIQEIAEDLEHQLSELNTLFTGLT